MRGLQDRDRCILRPVHHCRVKIGPAQQAFPSGFRAGRSTCSERPPSHQERPPSRSRRRRCRALVRVLDQRSDLLSHFRSSDMRPERPPGHWQPHAFSAPSQRPALPRPRPPPAKSQAEGPLERAAEMFRNPASTSGSSKPAAPSSASVADLQRTTAPKTPPKHPGPQSVQKA